MSSIQTQRWQYLNATLNTARGGTRAVLHGSDIVIIGGQDNYMRRTADVNIIDTNAVQRYIGGQLAFATCYASTIILGNILYVFGGMGNTGLEKRYQYATMPTGTSTTYPTHNPSSNPTNIPSQYPTFVPSQYPTFVPSQYPTFVPSQYPTFVPSQHPTFVPSIHTPPQSPTGTPPFHPMIATLNSSYSTTELIDTMPSNDKIYSTRERERMDKINTESESFDWLLMALVALIVSLCICAIYALRFVMQRDKTAAALPKCEHVKARINQHRLNNKMYKQLEVPELHKVESLSMDPNVQRNASDVEHAHDREDINAIVNIAAANALYNNDHVIAGGNTLGEGDVMGFLDAASGDDIIVGDDETDVGETVI
eukprot:777046_1